MFLFHHIALNQMKERRCRIAWKLTLEARMGFAFKVAFSCRKVFSLMMKVPYVILQPQQCSSRSLFYEKWKMRTFRDLSVQSDDVNLNRTNTHRNLLSLAGRCAYQIPTASWVKSRTFISGICLLFSFLDLSLLCTFREKMLTKG